LYAYVTDWLMGLSASMTRRYWAETLLDAILNDHIH
jgi:hypothetical protein